MRRIALAALAFATACFDFDATMRGGPPDAGSDAATDGATLGEAGAFCASIDAAPTTFFCDDFDERPLPGAWNSFGQTAGTLALTDAGFVSPPSALEERTNAIDVLPIDVSLRKRVALPSPPATLALAFDIEPVAVDPSPGAAIVLSAIDFLDDAGDRYSVQLSIAMSGVAVELALGEQTGFADGGAQYQNHPVPPSAALPVGAFTRVVVGVQWTSAAAAQASVTVGGAKVLDVPLTMPIAPTGLQIGVGTSYVSTPSRGWTLRYDDVLFTVK